jgi:hypothetical protein
LDLFLCLSGRWLAAQVLFLDSYYLWLQQQKKEVRTLANAFMIDLERIYNKNFPAYLTIKNNPETVIFCPDDKFYDRNGAYFLFYS